MSLNPVGTSDAPLLEPEEFTRSVRKRSPWERLLANLAVRNWLLMLTIRAAAKRALDITGAIAGLVLLGPLLLITAIAIRIESPGPVLFRQVRVGKRGRLFTMFKFRSMRVTAETEKHALYGNNESVDGVLFKMKRDPRITRVGRLLRRLSVDELPQLLNVLCGDMSIVGPRPAVPTEVAQYDLEARKRLQTKPGLTCLWQISGRSELAFSEQIDLDLRYLQARSLAKDIAIIAKTVPAVITGRGAY